MGRRLPLHIGNKHRMRHDIPSSYNSRYHYPWERMKVGDTFRRRAKDDECPRCLQQAIVSAALYRQKKHGGRYQTRRDDTLITCTRIA